MSVFSLSLGKGKTGITLNAQKTDIDGNNVDSVITTGFTEIGSGFYIWNYNLNNDFEGCIKFIDSSNDEVLAFTSVNLSQLSPNGLDNIEIEGNLSIKDTLKIIASILAGEVAIDGNIVRFKAINNPSITRVESDTTPLGERIAVDINL
jgi:hypothetical protein